LTLSSRTPLTAHPCKHEYLVAPSLLLQPNLRFVWRKGNICPPRSDFQELCRLTKKLFVRNCLCYPNKSSTLFFQSLQSPSRDRASLLPCLSFCHIVQFSRCSFPASKARQNPSASQMNCVRPL